MTSSTMPLIRVVGGRHLPAAGTWHFEAGNSSISFVVKHMMISKVRGSFRDFHGTIVVADDLPASTVCADIVAASIDTGMSVRDNDLRGPDFLDAQNHPEIAFRSTGMRDAGDAWTVTGDLTIAGRTRSVELATRFQGAGIDPWGNAKGVFAATTEIVREDWGLTYNRAIESGGVLIGSTVRIEIEIQAKPGRLASAGAAR